MTNAERGLVVVAVLEAGALLACVLGFVSTGRWEWLYAAGAVAAVFLLIHVRMIMAIRREKAAMARGAASQGAPIGDVNENR